jgi:hypothetical protein
MVHFVKYLNSSQAEIRPKKIAACNDTYYEFYYPEATNATRTNHPRRRGTDDDDDGDDEEEMEGDDRFTVQ